jgi:hypothetical protein
MSVGVESMFNLVACRASNLLLTSVKEWAGAGGPRRLHGEGLFEAHLLLVVTHFLAGC